MARFYASAIIASTPAAATYFDRVAAYIAGRMRDPPAIAWHLDQIALDVAHLVSDDIALSDLPLGAMLIARTGRRHSGRRLFLGRQLFDHSERPEAGAPDL